MKACFISSVECSILWEVLRFTFTFIWLCKYMVLLQNSQSHSTVPYLKSPTCFLLSLLLYCFTRMSALCPHWNLKSWRPVCTILSGTTQNLQDSYWLLSTSQWFLAPSLSLAAHVVYMFFMIAALYTAPNGLFAVSFMLFLIS